MKKVILSLLIMAVLIFSWYFSQRENHRTAFSATVEADEARLASRAGGRVVELLAEEGDVLAAGRTIVRLEAPELTARRAMAAAALAELEQGPRPQEIAAAKAEWSAAAAERDYARDDAKRKKELFEKDVVPVQERDLADSRAAALEQKVGAAKERLALLEAGTRPEKLAQARAQLAELDALLAELEVRAPGDVVLDTLYARPGDVLAAGAPVATVLLGRAPWIRVYLTADRAGRMKVGDRLPVRPDALPGVTVTGTVEQIGRKAEFTPRNVQTPDERIEQMFGVKIRLDDPAGRVRAGMTAVVDVPPAGG